MPSSQRIAFQGKGEETMRGLRNLIAFNWGFWIVGFLCLAFSSCTSPSKEEVPTKKTKMQDSIHDRGSEEHDDYRHNTMMNVVDGDEDLERMREQNLQMEKIIDGLEKLNGSLETLAETISAN